MRQWRGLLAVEMLSDDEIFDAQPSSTCAAAAAGVTVLEASAGTGKTYTIAALAARFIAEGTPSISCCW